MSCSKVGSCPVCGAPIYNKPIVFADSKGMERESVFDVIRDDDGLPKNFFTCSCGLPKIVSHLPEVDIDEPRSIKQASFACEQHQKVAAMERLQKLLMAGKSVVIEAVELSDKFEFHLTVGDRVEHVKFSSDWKKCISESVADAILNLKAGK